MPFRSVSFPITLGRPVDGLILGARMAVADVIRTEARNAVTRAAAGGIDMQTLGQRVALTYVAAANASRFLRAFPQPVARWCIQVEQQAPQLTSEQYQAAPPNCIGSYGPGWIGVMPGNLVLVTAGGIRASGLIAEGDLPIVLHEVREVRIYRSLDNNGEPCFWCQVIMSSDAGHRDLVSDPAEPQPETEDA